MDRGTTLSCGVHAAVVVDLNDGFTHWAGDGTVECAGRPVAIDGSHKNIVLQGNYRRIRIAGSFAVHDAAVVDRPTQP